MNREPYIGQKVTVIKDVFHECGVAVLDKDQILTVRDVEYTGGHYVHGDMWIPKTVSLIKLVDIAGSWQLDTFKEFNNG